jgi:hypothetical protein
VAVFQPSATVFSAQPVAAQVRPQGPLTTEEGGPLQRLSLTAATEIADVLGRGRVQADLWMAYSNIFEQDSAATHELYLDMERLITHVGLRFGATDRIDVGGRLTLETTGGGVLDGFISDWHHRFGLQNANRDRYPEDAYGQRLRDASGEVRLLVPQRTLALEDVRLFGKWQAFADDDGRRVLSLKSEVRIPTHSDQVGDERTDLAVLALFRASGRRWHLHGMAGGSTVRRSPGLEAVLRSSAWIVAAGLERTLLPWLSAVVQYSVATPRLRGVGDTDVDGWPTNLVFGLAGTMGDGWSWDASFQEDLPANSPAVDFTLGVAVRRRW